MVLLSFLIVYYIMIAVSLVAHAFLPFLYLWLRLQPRRWDQTRIAPDIFSVAPAFGPQSCGIVLE